MTESTAPVSVDAGEGDTSAKLVIRTKLAAPVTSQLFLASTS